MQSFLLETYIGEEKISSPRKPLMLGVGRRDMRTANRRTATQSRVGLVDCTEKERRSSWGNLIMKWSMSNPPLWLDIILLLFKIGIHEFIQYLTNIYLAPAMYQTLF